MIMDPNIPQTSAQTSSQPPVQGVSPQQPPNVPPSNSSMLKKRLPLILVALVVLLGIGFGSFFLLNSRPQTNEEVANKEDKLLATVGKYEIRESTVLAQAQLEYSQDAIDDDVLKRYLESQIERRILDLEAEKLSLVVTDEEVAAEVGNNDSQVARNAAYYELLKEKIMKSQIKSVQAFTIGYWVRPLNDPHQLPIYAEQRSEGSQMLAEANSRLRQGEAPVEIGKLLYEKYTSLKPIIALNGYLLDKPNDEQLYLTPKLYSFDKEELASSNDPEVYNAMLDMDPNEVRRVNRSDGSGGVVIKLIEATPGEFEEYDNFLAIRREQLVTLH